MRKFFLLAAACCFAFASCDKPSTQEPLPDKDPDNQGQDTVEVKTPVLTLTSDTLVELGMNGGPVTITYTLTNEVEGGELSAAVEGGDWCQELNYATPGQVTCVVPANPNEADRECVITVTYAYGDESTGFDVTVRQVYTSPYNYDFKATRIDGFYYADKESSIHGGQMEYLFYLSDLGLDENGRKINGGTYYTIDLYSTAPEDLYAVAPPVGIYTLNSEGLTDIGTFSKAYSDFGILDEDGSYTDGPWRFTSGTVEIEADGENYIYTLILGDAYGNTHRVTYEGPVVLKNEAGTETWQSTLTEDIDLSLTDATIRGYYWSDSKISGVREYSISLFDANRQVNWCYQIYLLLPHERTFADGLDEGTFHISTTNEPNTLVAGYIDREGYKAGAWIYDVYYGDDMPKSPILDGSVTISFDEETGLHTFVFDCVDDNTDTPHKLTGTITGKLDVKNIYNYE